MKKNSFLFILSLAYIFANSQTIISGGTASGVWTKEGSPYQIMSSITVPEDSTLIIEPGVYVEFQYNTSIVINGTIKAIGNENDSIYFDRPQPKGTNGLTEKYLYWRGFVYYKNLNNDTTVFSFCNFKHARAISANPKYGNGGAFYVFESEDLTIKNCKFSENIANDSGGAIYCVLSLNINVVNNVFIQNTAISGGALYSAAYCNIIGNLFTENHADFGGAITVTNFYPRILNNLIVENNAETIGGGIYFSSTFAGERSGSFVNNTIADNFTSGYGAAIGINESILEFVNCIIYDNKDTLNDFQIAIFTNDIYHFFYNCDIEGGINGIYIEIGEPFPGVFENIIDENPWLLQNQEDKYSLIKGSPCINAGTPDTSGLLLPPTDFKGLMRISLDTIDIGAYEYQLPVSYLSQTMEHSVKIFPNPATDKLCILTDNKSEILKIDIYDLSGKKFYEYSLKKGQEIDISSLSKGVYILTVFGEYARQSFKFVKK